MKLRDILWHSNAPWSQSGYGEQTRLFTKLLAHIGHRVVISSFWGLNGARLIYDGLEVWPCQANSFGSDDIPVFAAHLGGGDPFDPLVITLVDAWALDPRHLAALAVASWAPIDHHQLQPKIREFFEITKAVPVAMSHHGVRELQDASFDPLYVPHGIDTEILQPLDQADCRGELGLPKDAFVVGMVAANQGCTPPRKAFPQAFEAFAEFRRTHKDAILYLHTFLDADPGRRNGIDLHDLIRFFDLAGSVCFSPEMKMRLGVKTAEMAQMYSSFDVLLLPSYGEGFGIPIIEAQACGVPVIVNDFSSMPELCGAGWKTEGVPYATHGHGAGTAWWQEPKASSIYECLEAAYENAANLGDVAREFAVGYDCRTILTDYWLPALGAIEDRLADKRQMVREALIGMPTAKLNRAQRRAAAKA